MKIPRHSGRISDRKFPPFTFLVIGIAILALGTTYILGTSSLTPSGKMIGAGAIIIAFIIVCAIIFIKLPERKREGEDSVGPQPFDADQTLLAFDEASLFFAGAIKTSDAFRLVCSRIAALIPYSTVVIYLLDESRTRLVAAEVNGMAAESFMGRVFGIEEELAGQCFLTREVQRDNYLHLDCDQSFGSTVAIPLFRDGEVFGVLQFFFEPGLDLTRMDQPLFEAVGERVAPIILSSIAFERTQTNALTDVTTDLPNERAFYLVLESQVADAQRNHDLRPLTVLSLDIKDFNEINQTYGHSAGDHVLNFVARVVKDNLRQMDFFARSFNDEFLAILPTADIDMSHEIITRVHSGFLGRNLRIRDDVSIEIELNIGWASFGNDGETPTQLLILAQLRKEQAKSFRQENVLWFPQKAAK